MKIQTSFSGFKSGIYKAKDTANFNEIDDITDDVNVDDDVNRGSDVECGNDADVLS